MDNITSDPEKESSQQEMIVEKQYEVFFHIVRLSAGFGLNGIAYDDHHYLSCMIQKKGVNNYRNPIGVERVFLGIFTKEGDETKRYYTERDQPLLPKEDFNRLARLVAEKYPISEGDIVITHPFATFINVAQYPLEERVLRIFQERLKAYSYLHYLPVAFRLA